MSTQINAKEVLAYLNRLGYTNINAVQLQDFIKDLKKLKKYEEHKIHEPPLDETKLIKINIIRESDKELKTGINALQKRKDACISENDLSSEPSNTEPSSVQQKNIDMTKKNYLQASENSKIVCPVHFVKRINSCQFPRPKTANITCNCPVNNSSSNNASMKYELEKKKRPVSYISESKTGTSSYPQSVTDSQRYSLNRKKSRIVGMCKCSQGLTGQCFCPGSIRPHSAVIKCNTDCAPPFQKCDPVNLHKYYQRQWKINKIPGENLSREKKFRWCFRERISCGPPVKK
ncbi:hypothetical protein WA026_012236 [Henosepilachna vigintioctopunctata]|uniref:Uncharacterized protein n=1 Tax=Henosepilachna vigintioctopunctata TaxID=420089 RepID=A0AAW1VFI0_9CUCU